MNTTCYHRDNDVGSTVLVVASHHVVGTTRGYPRTTLFSFTPPFFSSVPYFFLYIYDHYQSLIPGIHNILPVGYRQYLKFKWQF